MTPTEIYREAKHYISNLDKNIFTCDKGRTQKCNHEARFRHQLLLAFYAGYNEGIRKSKLKSK